MSGFFAGLDIGSLSTDVVIINERATLLGQAIVPTGANSTAAAEMALTQAMSQAGIGTRDLAGAVATGYGRAASPLPGRKVTEISCHAKGAAHLFPKTGTVIDIGGQDSKVIKVGPGGKVLDFNMNDKCAAGTGRFLEVMAAKLEVGLERLGPLSLLATKEVEISSVCTVFAESEVVSLVARNQPTEQIIKGLHRAIVNRLAAMAGQVGISGQVIMSGGVAKNKGVVALLEERFQTSIAVPEEPQLVGALGAALIAIEEGPR